MSWGLRSSMEGSRPVLVKHVAPTFYGRYFNVTDRFLTPSSMPNVWPSRKVNRLPIFRPYKESPTALCTEGPHPNMVNHMVPIFLRPLFFVLADRFLTPSSMPNAWPSREVNRLPLNERCVRDLSPWNVVLVTLAIWLKSMVRWVSYKNKGIYQNHFTTYYWCFLNFL